MNQKLSRRDFLILSGIGLTSLAFKPSFDFGELQSSDQLIRVSTPSVSVYSQPDDKSVINFQRFRDEIINVYYEVVSDKSPSYNPLWYRVWGGYIHSGRVQKVAVKINSVPSYLAEGMFAAEVTVPFSQSYLLRKSNVWTPLYRLYFSTVHWVVGIAEGPDGEPWYRIRDEILGYDERLDYYIPAKHMRLIPLEETTPISPDIPAEKKRIEVSLQDQILTAFENDKQILKTKISSGLSFQPPGKIPWTTPKGSFNVQLKMPSKHMGESWLVFDPEAYIMPGVPWVSFFEPETGVAFHGTYWHQNFGMPMSHGCINMKTEEARWLFRWVSPPMETLEVVTNGLGTQVLVY
jgi:lipoprotein-anchoring transpeptidase ErfK/SrfK